ncbi:MAG: tetratricopeptide repeat protein [Myxococcales bacterium]|nr:MAG: tetratricopeptide repeat protein [Myxococcales bacterium]
MKHDRTKILEAAQKHASKGFYDKAIAEYQKIIASDPRDIRTLLRVGDLHSRKGDLSEASNVYSRVAEQYARQGFFLKAIAVYKQILKLDPSRIDIAMRLAETYKQLALVSDALSTYEHIAALHFERTEYSQGLSALAMMVDLDPTNVPVRIKYAEALSQHGSTMAAAEQFEAGAQLLKEQNRTDDYIKVCERLLYHRSDDTALAKEIAALYLKRKNPKLALTKLQICFSKEPHNIAVLELLADAFQQLQQIPKAISVYKEIARLEKEANRAREHAAVLKKILELSPNDDDVRQALAAYAPGTLSGAPVPSIEPPVTEAELVEVEDVELIDDNELQPISDAPSSSLPPEVAREAKIARLLTECKVYESYGLQKEVTKQLTKILTIAPEHIETREKLKDIYLASGKNNEAKEQLLALATLYGSSQPAKAREYHEHARTLGSSAQLQPTFPDSDEGTGRTQQEVVREHTAQVIKAASAAKSPAAPAAKVPQPPVGTLRPMSPQEFEAIPVRNLAPNPKPVAPENASLRVEQALDEAEFFLVQGLLSETKQALNEILTVHPGHPLVLSKLREVDSLLSESRDEPIITIDDTDQSFLLAEKLAEEISQEDLDEGGDVLDVENVFRQFKQGVKAQLNDEDTETHFDLGIAYKEMGLLDDAIEEFRVCLNSPQRECNASTMIGICFKEKGQLTEAIKNFKRGLHAENKTKEEELGLYYELGLAYETLGDLSEAAYFFQEVVKRDKTHRDAEKKAQALSQAAK